MRTPRGAGFGLLTLATTTAALAQQIPPRYAVTEFGAFSNGSTQAHALNDLGHATGESGVGQISIGTHAFVSDLNGGLENIETLPGVDLSAGKAINNSGQVAGDTTTFVGQAGFTSLFRYTPGEGMVDLGRPGGQNALVIDMNDAGVVLAISWGVTRGWIHSGEGGWTDLGTLGGHTTVPHDINNAGQVVGYTYNAELDFRAFVWQDGQMQDLGTLGGENSIAYYISDEGVVVGRSAMADGTQSAFRYAPATGMQPLPAPAGARDIAATWVTPSGHIMGWFHDDATQRGFRYTDDSGAVDLGVDLGFPAWTSPVAMNDAGEILLLAMNMQTYEVSSLLHTPGGGPYNLNDLLATELQWGFTSPADINDSGQILVSGFSVNGYRSALLTPITPGDLDADGAVNLADLSTLLAHYGAAGASYADGDIDADGQVTLLDLSALLSVFGS